MGFRSILGACGFLAIAMAGPVIADDDATREAFRNAVRNLPIEEAARNSGMASHQLHIAEDHLRDLFGDEAVVEFLTDEMMRAMPLLTREESGAAKGMIRDFAAALVQDRAAHGVKRLSASDQRQFLVMLADLLRAMPIETCARMLGGELTATENQRAELQALAGKSEDFVRSWMALTRKAIKAEIHDRPVFIPLGPSERSMAEAAYTETMLALLEDHPRMMGVITASTEPHAATHQGSCDLGLLTLETATSMEGVVGDWAVRMMSDG